MMPTSAQASSVANKIFWHAPGATHRREQNLRGRARN
jgi:hypothetical protein